MEYNIKFNCTDQSGPSEMYDIIRLNGFTNVKLAVRVCTALRGVLNWRLQRTATFSLACDMCHVFVYLCFSVIYVIVSVKHVQYNKCLILF